MSDAAVMVVVRCVIVLGRHFGSLGSSLWAVGTAAVAVKTPMGCAGSAAQRELTAQRLVRAMQPDPGVVSRDAGLARELRYRRAVQIHTFDRRRVFRLEGLHQRCDAGAHLIAQHFVGTGL